VVVSGGVSGSSCAACGADIRQLAPDAKFCRGGACRQRAYRERKRIAAKAGSLSRLERAALLTRHEVAMRIAVELAPSERLALLAAVVWPVDQRLREAA